MLGMVAHIMVLTPTATYWMQWAGTSNSSSLIAMVGNYYFLGGAVQVLAGIGEFVSVYLDGHHIFQTDIDSSSF